MVVGTNSARYQLGRSLQGGVLPPPPTPFPTVREHREDLNKVPGVGFCSNVSRVRVNVQREVHVRSIGAERVCARFPERKVAVAPSFVNLAIRLHVFLLQPHHRNFSKRLVKRPKLYFYDTGLCCSLLRIDSETQLTTHYLKGALFENLILTEFLKRRYNQGKAPNLYFWRDHRGMEIDLIIENSDGLVPVEIKSAKTWNPDFFLNMEKWNGWSGNRPENSHVVYGGDESVKTARGMLHSWKSLDFIL